MSLLKRLCGVLSKEFCSNKNVKVISQKSQQYQCQSEGGDQMDVVILETNGEMVTAKITIYREEYWDEGLGMMAGGNADVCRITFAKTGPPNTQITYL